MKIRENDLVICQSCFDKFLWIQEVPFRFPIIQTFGSFFQDYAACEIIMGVLGGIAAVVSVVVILAYRNYKYEQELDSLLWKIGN